MVLASFNDISDPYSVVIELQIDVAPGGWIYFHIFYHLDDDWDLNNEEVYFKYMEANLFVAIRDSLSLVCKKFRCTSSYKWLFEDNYFYELYGQIYDNFFNGMWKEFKDHPKAKRITKLLAYDATKQSHSPARK